MQERRVTPGLLLLSTCIFLLLIPGGPIENRIYPDMPLFVALTLSLIATVLLICALFSVFQTRRGGRSALHAAAWEASGFAAFYLLSLSGALSSPTPIAAAVRTFEIAGLAVALLLIVSVMRDLGRRRPNIKIPSEMSRGEMAGLIALSIYVGAILAFIATVNIVSRQPALYMWYGMR